MKINLAYGQGHLPVDLPEERTTVIEPGHRPGLPDERGAVVAALDNPISRPPFAPMDQTRRPRLHCLHRFDARHAQ